MSAGEKQSPKLTAAPSPAGGRPGPGSPGSGEEGAPHPLHLAQGTRRQSPTPPRSPRFAFFVCSCATLAWGSGSNFIPIPVRPGPDLSPRPRAGSPAPAGRPLSRTPGSPWRPDRCPEPGCQGTAGWPRAPPRCGRTAVLPGQGRGGERLRVRRGVGALHLLSFMAPEDPPGSSRRVPGLGHFVVGAHIASHPCLIFPRVAGRAVRAGPAPTPRWGGWGPGYWGGDTGSPRSTAHSASHPGAATPRGQGSGLRLGRTARPPGTDPCPSPPQGAAPPPPCAPSAPPRPRGSERPAESRGPGGARGGRGLRGCAPPARGSVATAPIGSHFLQLPRPGLRGLRRRLRRPERGGGGAGRRRGDPAAAAQRAGGAGSRARPSPAAEQAQLRVAAPRCPPFPAILYPPGAFPTRGSADKAGGSRGPPHPRALRPRPPLPPRRLRARRRHSFCPGGSAGTPLVATRVLGGPSRQPTLFAGRGGPHRRAAGRKAGHPFGAESLIEWVRGGVRAPEPPPPRVVLPSRRTPKKPAAWASEAPWLPASAAHGELRAPFSGRQCCLPGPLPAQLLRSP